MAPLPNPVCVLCGKPKVYWPGIRWVCQECEVRKPCHAEGDLTVSQREDLQRVLWGAIRSGFLGDERCSCCGAIPTRYVVTDPARYNTEWCCPMRAAEIARTHRVFAQGILPNHQAMWNLVKLL